MEKWIDIHTHINFLEEKADHTVQAALDAGVERMITIGTCPADHPEVMSLAERFSPYVYCTLGVHPHEAELYNETCEEYILAHAPHHRVVALGEMGLDYYYDNAPRDLQRKVFRSQLELAVNQDLPVQIHTRDAEEETVES
jgi:TatD DNase family protein